MKYYVFLDIDGTLWDNSESSIKKVSSKNLHPDSVNSVNFLCDQLRVNGYTPEIVIISKQRIRWIECCWNLVQQGIDRTVPLIKLPIGKFTRGERISLMLHDINRGKNVYETGHKFSVFDYLHLDYAKKCDNYVVIDDKPEALANIPQSNYIQTDIDCGRLNMEMVSDYLKQKGFNIMLESGTTIAPRKEVEKAK